MPDDVNQWWRNGAAMDWPHNVRRRPIPGVVVTPKTVQLYLRVPSSVWHRSVAITTDRRPTLFLLSLVILHPETEPVVREILASA